MQPTSNGTMGRSIHPKIVARVRELLRKKDLTVPMIAERTGVSPSQIRNIAAGRVAAARRGRPKGQPNPMQREFNEIFGEDAIELPPIESDTPKPVKDAHKDKPTGKSDLFAELPTQRKDKFTPEKQAKVIRHLRRNMPYAMIASQFGITVHDVETLADRVYWLQNEDDENVFKPCLLTAREYLASVGPRFTKEQAKTLLPLFNQMEAVIMETLNVDQTAAATIRKVAMLNHYETGRKPSILETPEPTATTPTIAQPAVLSDELETLNGLCIKYFGREPEPPILDAWLAGDNGLGMKLETFEMDGQLLTTERHFVEFFPNVAAACLPGIRKSDGVASS